MKVIYCSHVQQILREEIRSWQAEKRSSGRFSVGWHRADAAEIALRHTLRRLRRLETINARLA